MDKIFNQNICAKNIDICRTLLFLFVCVSIAVFIAILVSEPLTLKIMSEKYPPKAILEQPWNQSNLTFFIDDSGVPIEDIQIYLCNSLISFKWWEGEGSKRLGYQVNFNRVYNPNISNITINWKLNNYTTNENVHGHTYINTTNHSGDRTCDTYNPPFTRCNISIKLGLDDAQMQKVIKHEIGHAFTLKHFFNSSDYNVRIGYGINYLTNPSDIMFDDVLINAKKMLHDMLKNWIFIFSFISLLILYLIYHLSRCKYR